MTVFMQYIQPLTDWLHTHAEWALTLTFLISFAESLAIIGSIVPGSIIMTMVGILAGSGIMRIDLTLIAATLGAIAGDGGSYLLGYILSDRLLFLWPFKHHPKWLKYGRDYFERHGGKSIFFGRFIGPLRSIIPVIAGMMRMRRIEFILANSISALAWSIVYVGPGILIGTASAELSTESATHLFLLVLGILIITWFISLSLKWIWNHLRHLFRELLHRAWCRIINLYPLGSFVNKITPPNELNHAPTALLITVTCFCILLSISLILLIKNGLTLQSIDAPIYFFLQSLRTKYFDIFFTTTTLLLHPYSLGLLIAALLGGACYTRDRRSFYYWLSLSISCTLLTLCLNSYLSAPTTQTLQVQPTLLFPPALMLATTCFSFLLFKINNLSYRYLTQILQIILVSLLLLTGTALLYLGDSGATGVLTTYAIGVSVCLLHWIIYRRREKTTEQLFTVIVSLLLFAVAAFYNAYHNYSSALREHSPYPKQYLLTHHAWWNQRSPLLPLYTTNRLGRPIGLFNIQYLGTLQAFQTALETQGWKKQSHSLLQAVLLRTSTKPFKQHFPLKTSFYLSKKPTLTMTYGPPKGEPLFVISLWRSNYHLIDYPQPLWLGSFQPYRASKQEATLQNPLLSALYNFEIHIQPLPAATSSLFMIKEDDRRE